MIADTPGNNDAARKLDTDEKNRQHAEKTKPHHDALDDALADSFPASDPPAPVAQGTTSNPRPHEKDRDAER